MRTPNYNFERQERDKAKAAKKAAAKANAGKSNSKTRSQHWREALQDTSSSSAD